ncbi:uncharacterized protein BYT42DRAFT_647738 [Radiomyces spectabilis]|uniref:uncharacterized protein n=1 Tax=Radiomyces spectabilis TaxID=64574 RepID=UPI00221E38C0|nr:uncharacterized protein BYT42DRAFT_647738 [Radiomyces spectabilis]KAI8370491.1 hypothetical protein BYT42DRAFT_647738 [Radiomyces spectabilis]
MPDEDTLLPPYTEEGVPADNSIRSTRTPTSSSKYDHGDHENDSHDFIWALGLPILNIAITCVLIGVIIYIYIKSTGKDNSFTMAGMKAPTILALVVMLVKLFIGGGITIAMSEYKWVRLQRAEGPLSLLEVYDACTRGVGGIIRILPALRFEIPIVIAVIFQLGLLTLLPASQEILASKADIVCSDDPWSYIQLNNVTSDDFSTWANIYYNPMSVRGIQQSFIVRQAFYEAGLKLAARPRYRCATDAFNCTYDEIPTPHTVAECQLGSLQSRIVDVRGNNVTTISGYYGFDRPVTLLEPTARVPKVFYAGSMLGRTAYELYNYTEPMRYNDTYDPSFRQYFGDQSFVFLSNNNTLSTFSTKKEELVIYECTLRSHVNVSSFIAKGRDLIQENIVSTPITFDYNTLSNNTYWKEAGSHYPTNFTMMNLYAMQLTYLKTLIVDGLEADLLYKFSTSATPQEFMRRVLYHADLAVAFELPTGSSGYTGSRCHKTDTYYVPDPKSFYPFALCLIIPLASWVGLWIVSLYHTNGVSRGVSQTALLVTGLTPAVRDQMKGLSHSGERALVQRAKKVNVMLGESQTNGHQAGHVGFGVKDELNSIRAR